MRRLWFGSSRRAFDVSGRGPFGELAGVVGVFYFHQAGQLAHDFDSARERIVEFPARGDMIADGILPFRQNHYWRATIIDFQYWVG